MIQYQFKSMIIHLPDIFIGQCGETKNMAYRKAASPQDPLSFNSLMNGKLARNSSSESLHPAETPGKKPYLFPSGKTLEPS
jgi:hypothetical protein